jgi:ectoine hydroxylase-related dioxygenase (phytanoyl-CoA dioxygenase family)
MLETIGEMLALCETSNLVTPAEKDAFEENGYHVLRGALSAAEVRRYREAMARVLLTPEDHPYADRIAATELRPAPPDNPRAAWAAFDLLLFDDAFWDLAYQPNVALAVDALIGPDINLYETSSISKMPGFPGNFRDWHQDSEYSDPQSNDRHVTAILFLDEMDGESGATWVIPGTHLLGPLPHVLPAEEVSAQAKEVEDKRLYAPKGISFHFQPGDALIFLVRIIHKSGPNLSDRSRWSLAYNYVRKDTHDLGRVNRFTGAYLPITRGGRLYQPQRDGLESASNRI